MGGAYLDAIVGHKRFLSVSDVHEYVLDAEKTATPRRHRRAVLERKHVAGFPRM
jgi:hypothetical protein